MRRAQKTRTAREDAIVELDRAAVCIPLLLLQLVCMTDCLVSHMPHLTLGLNGL